MNVPFCCYGVAMIEAAMASRALAADALGWWFLGVLSLSMAGPARADII
jgi:hypothetical protein